jgi:spore coat protein U-like protein
VISTFSSRRVGVPCIATLLLLAAPGMVLAAGSGTVALSGAVALSCNVTLNGGSSVTVNNLAVGTAVTEQTIANVVEQCNKATGYDIVITTANGTGSTPQLTGATSGEALSYSLKYDGDSLSFGSKAAKVSYASRTTGSGSSSKPLKISFPAKDLAADTYTDTLTVTISAR